MDKFALWINFKRSLSLEKKNIANMSQLFSRPDAKIVCENCVLIYNKSQNKCTFRLKIGESDLFVLTSGTIYNLPQLKYELEKKGYKLQTALFPEVLAYAYFEWKEKFAEKFDGIFSFVIFDLNSKKLFACRDKMGVKPLFFYCQDDGIILSTQASVILKNSYVERKVNQSGLNELLLLGPGRSGGSGIIKNMYALKPAQCLSFDKEGLKFFTYWQLKAMQHTDSQVKTIEKTRSLIVSAIERQLDYERPFASFLSGGLDSSIISCIAAKKFKERGKTLTTYSIDYKDNDKYFLSSAYQPESDSAYADIMAQFINSNHKNIVLDYLEVAKAIKKASKARTFAGMADIDSSLLLACKAVRKNHDICMSGECADELFGGYPWYHNKELLFKPTFPWADSIDIRLKLFNENYIKSPHEFVKSEYDKIIVFTDYLPKDDKLNRRIREMFMLNYYSFMQTLTERQETMSSYCNLEIRAPFCSSEIIEYAFNMPWNLKAYNGREKGIMREAFKDLLPEKVIFRKKSPFPKTYNPAFCEYIKSKAVGVIKKGGTVASLINKDFFEKLLNYNIDVFWYGQLMKVPQIFGYIVQLDNFFESNKISIEL